MGNFQSNIQKINFEDVQTVCKNTEIYLLINTLPEFEQKCLIKGTVNASQEEVLINKHITGNKSIQIIIYGRNSNDDTVYKKYQQLKTLGFPNIFIYMGGLFEWLMLQDIYGFEDFPTTVKELDLLKYKPCQRLNIRLLT
jgi:hypothetical protein